MKSIYCVSFAQIMKSVSALFLKPLFLKPDGSENSTAHASKSLTSVERNYPQIERETSAIAFVAKRFHGVL